MMNGAKRNGDGRLGTDQWILLAPKLRNYPRLSQGRCQKRAEPGAKRADKPSQKGGWLGRFDPEVLLVKLKVN